MRNVSKLIFGAAIAVFAAVVCFEKPAAAQNHSWCAEYDCHPLRGAVVDLWHADENGEYDNNGFRYRGHVITGPDGAFRFRTIMPALYSGRTRHYHVKVQAPGSRLLTTQLYFPNEPANLRDGLFQRELLMRMADAGDDLAGPVRFYTQFR
jgi:Dioxygenase